jgi:hypothetical protein
MKSLNPLLFLLAVFLSFFSNTLFTTKMTANGLTPDRLEIMRTTGTSSHIAAHLMVTQLQPVQNLYSDMLSLPPAAADQICPQYVIADYNLTFFSGTTVVQKANVLNGECQPVTLGSNDIRTANANFWKLMNNALTAGLPIPASVCGNTSPAANTTGSQ